MSVNRVRDAVAVVLFLCAVGMAQAQSDIAASLYGSFGGSTSGNGVQQSPSNAAGVLLELRHLSNPLIGYELTYSYNHNDQTYTEPAVSCGLPCGSATTVTKYVPANAHEVTADYIVSVPIMNMRPFVLAGGGLIFNSPSGSQSGTGSVTQPVFVYGVGLDYTILPHIGIRGQYRGNVYKAPQLASAFSSTGAFTKTAEPMLGVYLRF
jgi:opacity protein-like surface antigen